MQSTRLPVPYAGLNDQTPIGVLQYPYCQYLLNFNYDNGAMQVRNGNSLYKQYKSSTVTTGSFKIANYGNANLYSASVAIGAGTNEFIDVDSNTVVYAPAIYAYQWAKLYFNKYLYFFGLGTVGACYNGAAWGPIGYTSAMGSLFGGTVYKNRAYMLHYQACSYSYSGISSVTGACTDVDLNQIVSEKCTLVGITSITITEQMGSEDYLAFIFSSGEILFYSGAYPNAADWKLVGRAVVPQPFDYHPVVPYQGDKLVITDGGLISLRDLFLRGSEQAIDLSISKNIQQLWSDSINYIRAQLNIPTGPISYGKTSAVWDTQKKRLIINLPYYTFGGNAYTSLGIGGAFFVYYTIEKAWAVHGSTPAAGNVAPLDMCLYKGKIVYLVDYFPAGYNYILEKEGASDFIDFYPSASTKTYPFWLRAAPYANEYANVNKIQGVDAIIKSDMFSEVNYSLVKDFGVQQTSLQKVTGVSGALQNSFINLGIEGNFVQLDISGSTTTGKTIGYELYGTTLWSDRGTSPR